MTSFQRGQVVRVRFDPVEGSGRAGERPAVVISPDFINRGGRMIIVAAITSRKTDRIYPSEALLEPPEGGLSVRSKVMLLHTRGVDKLRIVDTYGTVSAVTMSRIEEALRIVTGLRRLE